MIVSSKNDEEGEGAVDKGKLEKVAEGIEGMVGKGIKLVDSVVVPFEKGRQSHEKLHPRDKKKIEWDSRSKSL